MGDSVTPSTQDSAKNAWGGVGSRPLSGGNEKSLRFDEHSNLDREVNTKKGCWHKFSSCFGGLWATRQITNNDDREIYVRTALRELVVYTLFLTVLCILTFGASSSSMYYYTKVLSDLFLDAPFPDTKNTFKGSTQVLDIWRFMENVMLDGMYWENWYDVEMTPTLAADRNILYENHMLGVPRLRQVRVRNDSCEVHPDFANAIRQCYSVYADSALDEDPFGLMTGDAWTFHDASEIDGLDHWGKLATYGGGGSYQKLGQDRNTSNIILTKLRDELWITRGTRALFIDFTVYNANINLFCVIKLVFELPASGGVVPSWSFQTVKLLRYVNEMDYFIMACEFIFICFIFYYIVEEVLEIKVLKWKYFKALSNLLDLAVIILALVCIVFSIYSTMTISDTLASMLQDPTEYANFEFLGYSQSLYNSTVAVLVFFAWLKLLKYISFNKTMTQLSSTLSRCGKDVGSFTVMFFIVFFAYAQLGFLLFGSQVYDFHTFWDASFTLLRTILGDFNFHEIEEANRILGPLFFLTYVFFVFFVLLNMFLAIINDTYSEVKAEIANQRNEFEITDYFKRGYNNVMGKFGRRDKLLDIENAILCGDTNDDQQLTFQELRTSLKKCNFSDIEIEMFFCKYDLDNSRILTTDEIKKMLSDLEGQRHAIENKIEREVVTLEAQKQVADTLVQGSGVPTEEFTALSTRVTRLEHSIGSIVSKIDAVLIKLDSMKNMKSKKREAMSKIIDTITDDEK